jgi:hypothetical protein
MSKALLKSKHMESVLPCKQTKGVTKSRKMTKLVTVDLDLIKPCS